MESPKASFNNVWIRVSIESSRSSFTLLIHLLELPLLKSGDPFLLIDCLRTDWVVGACEELKIKPKITFIVVGKRHHVRSVDS